MNLENILPRSRLGESLYNQQERSPKHLQRLPHFDAPGTFWKQKNCHVGGRVKFWHFVSVYGMFSQRLATFGEPQYYIKCHSLCSGILKISILYLKFFNIQNLCV